MSNQDRKARRARVRRHIRKRLSGTAERPRLAVHRSICHIYCQAIDDSAGRTVAQASSNDPELRTKLASGSNIASATAVGAAIATRLKALGLHSVVFDRGGFLYHGRVKALAEAARQGGLQF